jgi:hypothetical protein
MARLLGPSLLALAACGGGTVQLGEDGPSATCPAARVDTESLEWVGTTLDASVDQVVVVTNDCTADEGDLEVAATTSGVGFLVTPETLTLAPGEDREVTITYVATGYEAAEGTLVLDTNDPDRASLEVALVATTAADQDGDGFAAIEAGGEDCDDGDPLVNPDAEEVWYDGVDQDCDGASDFDQDGDGFDRDPEGADCVDTDPAVFPASAERDNLVDDDCDGLVDEDFIRPGDVVITEVMADPAEAFDTAGEWFEVQNVSTRTVDLAGWQVSDLGGEAFTAEGPAVLEPGERWVFGVSDDISVNGGVLVDQVYARGAFELDNLSDTIALLVGENTVSLLEYDERYRPRPGRALSLDPFFTDGSTASLPEYWCPATSPMPAGDRGTPGRENDLCATVDHDGDNITAAQGDCEDFDPTIFPGADEIWDGIDQDCDGISDNATLDALEDGWVEGDRNEYLTVRNGLSMGDVDGDGDLEFMAATTRASSVEGLAYVLDAADVDTYADPAFDVDEAFIDVAGRWTHLGMVGRMQGDVTGDGTADVVMGGIDGYSFSDGPALVLLEGGSGISGNLDLDDAQATWSGSAQAQDFGQVLSHADLDGDGTAEIVHSDPGASDPAISDFRSRFRGAVRVLDGTTSSGDLDLQDDALAIWYGDNYYDYLGTMLDGADLDDDGYDDLVACAVYADTPDFNAGACYVVLGGATLPEGGSIGSRADITIGGRANNERFGDVGRLAIGDFDGDTELDLAVPNRNREEVRLWWSAGSLTGDYDTSDADVVIQPTSAADAFGTGIAVGDFDDDGQDDLAVGAPDSTSIFGAGDQLGEVWVWQGSVLATATGRTDETAAWASVTGRNNGDLFGWALLAADLDDDGKDDLAVGAPGTNSRAGRVSFLLGD